MIETRARVVAVAAGEIELAPLAGCGGCSACGGGCRIVRLGRAGPIRVPRVRVAGHPRAGDEVAVRIDADALRRGMLRTLLPPVAGALTGALGAAAVATLVTRGPDAFVGAGLLLGTLAGFALSKRLDTVVPLHVSLLPAGAGSPSRP